MNMARLWDAFGPRGVGGGVFLFVGIPAALEYGAVPGFID